MLTWASLPRAASVNTGTLLVIRQEDKNPETFLKLFYFLGKEKING
jgi:hypothetical protein